MRMLDQLTKKSECSKESEKINIKKNTSEFKESIEMQQNIKGETFCKKPIKRVELNSTAFLFESDHSSQLSGTQERTEMSRQQIYDNVQEKIRNNVIERSNQKNEQSSNKFSNQTASKYISRYQDIISRKTEPNHKIQDDLVSQKDQKSLSANPEHSSTAKKTAQPPERPSIKLVINNRNELHIQSNKSVAQVLGPYCRNNILKPFQNNNDDTNKNKGGLSKETQNKNLVPFKYEPSRNIWTVGLQFYAPATTFLRKHFKFDNLPRDTVRILVRHMNHKEGSYDVMGQMDRKTIEPRVNNLKIDQVVGKKDHISNVNHEPSSHSVELQNQIKSEDLKNTSYRTDVPSQTIKNMKSDNNSSFEPHLKNIAKFLLPHQREAVNMAIHKSGRIILADEMGLGKTVTALAISAYYKQDWPLLIICPGGLMENWKNEIDRFLNYKIKNGFYEDSEHSLNVATIRSIKDIANQNILIVSYDFIWRNVEYFKGYFQENDPCSQNAKDFSQKPIRKSSKGSNKAKIKKEAQRSQKTEYLKGLFESNDSEDFDSAEQNRKNHCIKQDTSIKKINERIRHIDSNLSCSNQFNNSEQFKDSQQKHDLNQRNDTKEFVSTRSVCVENSNKHQNFDTTPLITNKTKEKSFFTYKKKINMVICDEAHYLKTHDSKRSRSIIPFIRGMNRILLVTGTPALSRPSELFNLVYILHDFNQRDFLNRYCLSNTISKFKKDYNRYKGCQNEPELRQLLSSMMIRRTKQLLMKDLPPKIREHFILECENMGCSEDGVTDKNQDVSNESKTPSTLTKNNFLTTFFKKQTKKNTIQEDISLSGDEEPSIKPLSEHEERSQKIEKGILPDIKLPMVLNNNSYHNIMANFRLAASQKVKAVQRYVQKWLNHNKEEKLVLFAHHKIMLDGIETVLKESMKAEKQKFKKKHPSKISNPKNEANLRIGDICDDMMSSGPQNNTILETQSTKTFNQSDKRIRNTQNTLNPSTQTSVSISNAPNTSKHENQSQHLLSDTINGDGTHAQSQNIDPEYISEDEDKKINTESGGFNYIKIDGTTPQQNRARLVHSFQTDKNVKVAILSITSASVGITLHASNTVIFTELWWNPGNILQAEDRVHRIGQKSTVSIIFLLGKNTVDEQVWPKLIEKLKVLEKMDVGENVFGTVATREGKKLHSFKKNKRSL